MLDLRWYVKGIQVLAEVLRAAILQHRLPKLLFDVLAHFVIQALVCAILHQVAGHVLQMAVLFAVVRVLELVEAVSIIVEATSSA